MPGGAAGSAWRAGAVPECAPKGERRGKPVSRGEMLGAAGGASVSFCFPSRCCHENSSLSLWGNLFSTQFQGQKLFSLPWYILSWSFVNEFTIANFSFCMKHMMSSFISWFVFFSFPTQNELFICVTLTGLPICVIPQGNWLLGEKLCFTVRARAPCVQKQPWAQLLTSLSMRAELLGSVTAEPLLSRFAHSPHLLLLLAREVALLAWMLPREIPEGSRLHARLAGTSVCDFVFRGQGNQNSYMPVLKVQHKPQSLPRGSEWGP